MSRQKVGITLTAETLKVLDNLCNVTGLSKSMLISMAINTYALEKMPSRVLTSPISDTKQSEGITVR